MGNSLHNKIYLGRSAWMDSKALQAAMVAGAMASVALAWVALRALR